MDRRNFSRIAAWPFRVNRTAAMPVRTANPPVTTPTSPLTRPVSVVSAMDFLRAGYVDRSTLMSIPAFRRAVTLIAGTAGQLPYHAYNGDAQRVDRPFLSQPESGSGYTRSVTWTKVASDLLLDGASLLVIRERYADTFPKWAEHVAFDNWSQDQNTGEVMVSGEKLPPEDVILFYAPFQGLLWDAYPTVNVLAKLRETTYKYLDSPQAREYFVPAAGQEPDVTDVQEFLSDWNAARKQGVTAYIPAGIELRQLEMMTPEQLTLNASHEFAVAEVTRLTGIDATWLSINVSTRTYSNILDERRNFLDFVCAPFIQAIEQTLSKPGITPNGQYVKANVDSFLRMSTLDRMNAYSIGLPLGAYTKEEIRKLEDRPPLNSPEPEDANP